MKKIIVHLFFFLFSLLSLNSENDSLSNICGDSNSLKINIFSVNNGKGLQTSRNILKDALIEMGHQVFEKGITQKRKTNESHVDINIFFERINEGWLSLGSTNWFIPNPEWYSQSVSLLDKMDLILCRTHEVERIFQDRGKKTYFLGFSSLDCLQETIEKDYTSFFHLAGGSTFKGTNAIITSWNNQLSMPPLTIVHHRTDHSIFLRSQNPNLKLIAQRLPLTKLSDLQNHLGVHLCLSETEGFGHYLMEAMSTGAVVMTTDAPPMNEFITDKRCLVAYTHSSPFHLGIRYFVDPIHLEQQILNLMSLSIEELKEIGDYNRSQFLQRKREFRLNLEGVIQSLYINL